MNIVDPIRDKDDIQTMKEYLREWNEQKLLALFIWHQFQRIACRRHLEDTSERCSRMAYQDKRAEDWKQKQIKMTKRL